MMSQIKIIPALVGLCVLIIVGIAITIISKQCAKNNKTNITCKCFTTFGVIITVLSMLLVTIELIIILIAVNHGLYTYDITVEQLQHGISQSPAEDNLPDDLSGCIILFYKFGCNDCETIYNDLAKYVSETPNVYWISSRSKQGKSLREKYPIESVPTAIYIHTDNTDDYTKKALNCTNENGNTILDIDAINRLLYLQTQNR